MIIELFYGFGLKIGELEGLYCDRLPVFSDASESRWKFTSFCGRNIPIEDVTQCLYKEYVGSHVKYKEAVASSQGDGNTSPLTTIPFLPNRSGTCLGLRVIRRVIEWCGKNSVGITVTPEMLRNSYVKRLHDQNFSDTTICAAVGLEWESTLTNKYKSMERSRPN